MILTHDALQPVVARHFEGDDLIDTVTAICLAESGGETQAVNDNYPRWRPDPDSPYRYDYGLAQINSIHGFEAQRLLDDADYNLAAARRVYDRQGLRAWSTYNAGAHLPFMLSPLAWISLPASPGDEPPAEPPAGSGAPTPVIDRPRRLNVASDADVRA
ncbi:MAG: hypothetical protein EXR68_01470 [Dehalococcoidia bacterium]|nr:hypothetical protein [Dehalococcoidia bacterium]